MKLAESRFLNSQLEQFEKDTESYIASHKRAMQCFDVEAIIEVGLTLFNLIEKSERAWSDQVRSGKLEFHAKDAQKFKVLYTWWSRPCEHVLKKIKTFEDDGYTVNKAEAFRDAIGRCVAPLVDVDRAIESIKKLDRGEGRPLREVMNELRRRRAS